MSEPLTRERLDEIASAVQVLEYERKIDGPRCDTVISRQALRELAAAVPALLDALRWRRAGDELPEVGVAVTLDRVASHWALPHTAIFMPGDTWSHYDAISPVHPDDRWLPLPPRAKEAEASHD